jgi:putative transposase
MARKRYSAEQIIGHLRQAETRRSEGKTVLEVVRELGISEQTCYRWRKEYGGMRSCTCVRHWLSLSVGRVVCWVR